MFRHIAVRVAAAGVVGSATFCDGLGALQARLDQIDLARAAILKKTEILSQRLDTIEAGE
jgi:hypothetical protein